MASVLFNNADSITRAGLPAVQPVTMIARINIVAFGGAAVYDNYFGQSGGPVVACIDDTLLLGTDTNDYTGSTLANNTWYTIAWVRSGNNHTVYLDGVQDITATDADSSSTVIVGDFGNADAFGNFRLGFFKVWTAALSQAEVIAEARSRKPVRWANLFSWLPCFDASTATTDLSGVGGNYTVSNGALSDDALDPGVPWQRRGYLYLPVSGDEPAVTTFTPAHGASTVGQNQNLVVTFDVNVQAGSGNFVIKDLADGSTFESIDITNGSLVTFATNTLTVNPAGTLAKGKNYYIEIDDGAVENADDDTPWGGISGSSTWRFSVETDAPSGWFSPYLVLETWFSERMQLAGWYSRWLIDDSAAPAIIPSALVGTANPNPRVALVPSALTGSANPNARAAVVPAAFTATANPTARVAIVPAALVGTASSNPALAIAPSSFVGTAIGGPVPAIVTAPLTGTANPEPALPQNPIIPAEFVATANPTPTAAIVPAAQTGSSNPNPAVAIAPAALTGTSNPNARVALVPTPLTGSTSPSARVAVVSTPLVGSANPTPSAALLPLPLVGTANPTHRVAAVPAALTGAQSPLQRAAIVPTSLTGTENPQPILTGGAIVPATFVGTASPKPALALVTTPFAATANPAIVIPISPVPLTPATNPSHRAALVPTALTPTANPSFSIPIEPPALVPVTSGRPTLAIAAQALTPLAMAAGAALAIVPGPWSPTANPTPSVVVEVKPGDAIATLSKRGEATLGTVMSKAGTPATVLGRGQINVNVKKTP